MSFASFADPVIYAPTETRVSYLRKVAALTTGGLVLAGISGFISAAVFASSEILMSRWVSLAVVFGTMMIAQYGGRALVYNTSGAMKLVGFGVGAVFEGIAMGYLLLIAMVLSSANFGNPFVFIAQAFGLTALTAASMGLYLMTGPKNLSMIRTGLAMLALPMFALMIITLFFPIGGPMGILLSVGFVLISGAGLLYKLNEVVHKLPATAVVEGAFEITMGLLVLFWNLLSLLMRLQDRR